MICIYQANNFVTNFKNERNLRCTFRCHLYQCKQLQTFTMSKITETSHKYEMKRDEKKKQKKYLVRMQRIGNNSIRFAIWENNEYLGYYKIDKIEELQVNAKYMRNYLLILWFSVETKHMGTQLHTTQTHNFDWFKWLTYFAA